MRKVIFFHPRWQLGGVERTNMQWRRVLESAGMEVEFLTFGGDEARCKQDGVVNHGGIIAAMRALFALRRGDILIIAQSYYHIKILPLLVLLRIKGVMPILAERNSFLQFSRNRFKFMLYKILFPVTLRVFGKTIVNCDEIADEHPFSKYPRNRIITIPNPRFTEKDMAAIAGLQQGKIKPELRCIGRNHRQKNPGFTLQAAALAKQKGHAFTWHCGEDKGDGIRAAYIPDAFDFMQKNDFVLFFASVFEGLPNILLEARAAGLPVIYSVCPTGVREVMQGYDNGFEFAYNSAEDFNRILDSVMGDIAAGKIKRKPDPAFAKRYSLEACNLAEVIKRI